MTGGELAEVRRAAEEAARRGGEVLRQRFLGPRVVALKGAIDLGHRRRPRRRGSRAGFSAGRVRRSSHHRRGDFRGRGARRRTALVRRPPRRDHQLRARRPTLLRLGGGLGWRTSHWRERSTSRSSTSSTRRGRGAGTTVNGEHLSVSRCANLGEALVGTGFPYDVWSEARSSTAPLQRGVGQGAWSAPLRCRRARPRLRGRRSVRRLLRARALSLGRRRGNLAGARGRWTGDQARRGTDRAPRPTDSRHQRPHPR